MQSTGVQKWSDHAPVQATLVDMPMHPAGQVPAPCRLSSRKAERSGLRALFGRAAATTAAGSGGTKRGREDTAAQNAANVADDGQAHDSERADSKQLHRSKDQGVAITQDQSDAAQDDDLDVGQCTHLVGSAAAEQSAHAATNRVHNTRSPQTLQRKAGTGQKSLTSFLASKAPY